MRVLVWHVHGSWTTSFVAGDHEYLLPVLPDRGPDGRGRARTWDWPAAAREMTPEQLRGEHLDAVVLQRPHEADLVRRWTGRVPGADLPAVYVEHDTPRGPAVETRHPLADDDAVPVAHVTHFNRLAWDCGKAPSLVVEHGVPDPGHGYRGDTGSLAAVVNEPVRRWRVAGTDVLLRVAERVPVEVYGMGLDPLADLAPALRPGLHEDLPQHEMHARLGAHRAYLHPYRWTSLGLALIEAMTLGMPVLALSATAAPEAVPPAAGLVSSDVGALVARARYWLAEPAAARAAGLAAREHALAHFGLDRFLRDWDVLLQEVTR